MSATNPFHHLQNSQDKRSNKAKKNKGGFAVLGISILVLKGIKGLGYNVPTPIQRKAIPLILNDNDVVAMARTGSGKTGAFLIPTIHQLEAHSEAMGSRCIILSPTRELAAQTYTFCTGLSKFTNLRCCLITGGESIEEQFSRLAQNPDIIIASPGRLHHLLMEVKNLTLNKVTHVIFDEADRLFEMGFSDDITYILNRTTGNHQTLLFSATMPSMLAEFTRAGLKNPQVIRLNSDHQLSDNLRTSIINVRSTDKLPSLLFLLNEVIEEDKNICIFAATRHHVEYLKSMLTHAGFSLSCIYGKMDHSARKINLAKFTKKKTRILLVTDVAARGIDIPILDVVINYDFPYKPKLFVHRVGRVARAGKSGQAYSLASYSEIPYMVDLMLYLGKNLSNVTVKNDEDIIYYGNIPILSLSQFVEDINRYVYDDPEIEELERSMNNANKLYFKTRTVASPASVEKAKSLDRTKVHPEFLQYIPQEEVQAMDFIEKLKNFRPSQTIMEVTSAKDDTVKHIMDTKRKDQREKLTRKNNDEKYLEYLAGIERKSLNVSGNLELKSDQNEYKDDKYFLKKLPDNYYQQKGLSLKEEVTNSANLEDLLLDYVPDDSQSIFRTRSVKKWDSKKRNWVEKTSGVGLKNKSTFTNESGSKISIDGSLYSEWEGKTKMRIGREGEYEQDSDLSYLQGQQMSGRMRVRYGLRKKKTTVASGKELKTKEEIVKSKKDQIAKDLKRRGIKRTRTRTNTPRDSKRKRGAPSRSRMLV